MYASLAEIQKLTDPKEKSMALSIFELRQESEKHKKKAEATSKAILATANGQRMTRIERIAKRLPVAQRDALLAMSTAPSMAFSIGDDGTVVDPMTQILAIVESAAMSIPDVFNGTTNVEQEHPQDTQVMSKERAKEIADRLARSRSGPGATTADVRTPR